MEHFVIMREERYRTVRGEQYAELPQEDSLKLELEEFAKRAEEKAFGDYQKRNNHYQQAAGGYKGPYLHATFVNQGQHQQPPVAQKLKTSFSHPEVHYQQPLPHKIETAVVYHDGHAAPYPRTGFTHQGQFEQPNMRNQAPPSKTHGRVPNCDEVARLYGGVVFKEYDRNKMRRA